jgi:hypothetical protein
VSGLPVPLHLQNQIAIYEFNSSKKKKRKKEKEEQMSSVDAFSIAV